MHQKQFYVGVDWASQSHHVCVLQADGDRLGEQVFKHTGEGLARGGVGEVHALQVGQHGGLVVLDGGDHVVRAALVEQVPRHGVLGV